MCSRGVSASNALRRRAWGFAAMGVAMGYHLYQVGSLLKKAYDHAKEEMGKDFYRKDENGNYVRSRAVGYGADGANTRRVNPNASDERFNLEKIPRVKAGTDIGHELAMVRAGALSDQEIAKVFYISADHRVFQSDYQRFFMQATLYMMYRGIPSAAMHQQATETYYFYEKTRTESIIVYGPGHGIQTGTRKISLIEESLRYAGIPLHEPANRRSVDGQYGIIWAPFAGKIKESYVEGKDRLPVIPGNPLFLLEVWDTPSISRGVPVIAEFGGEVGKVSVKRGAMVDKGDELMRLKDPWALSSRALPCGAQCE